ncbi:hypothetical protein [Cohnella boryungensis]
MKYSMLDNGVDSLKATYLSIQNIEIQYDPTLAGYHHIKDAILTINHANEILFKYFLKTKQEHLIYKDITNYINARKQMKENHIAHIMDTKVKLETISFHEAIDRLEYICGEEIPIAFKKLLKDLNNYRNKIMHYEISIEEEEVRKLIHKLKSCYDYTIRFFDEKFGGIKKRFTSLRFDFTFEDYESTYYEEWADSQALYEFDMLDLMGNRRGGFSS